MIRIPLLICLSLFNGVMYGQDKKFLIQDVNEEYFNQHIRLYATLEHQHQNFFQKAFSYQGIETGILVNHEIQIGFYGATFISNLKINKEGHPLFVSIYQGGLLGGRIINGSNRIHAGGQMKIGFFKLTADPTDFHLFKTKNKLIQINGLMLSPQFFGELNMGNWCKLRTGISYNFYKYEDQSSFLMKDLRNISLVFGFVLGSF